MVQLVLLSFATWRITRLINVEHGPDGILEALRYRTGVTLNEEGEQVAREGSIAQLLICFNCLSCWIGVLFGLMYYRDPVMGLGIAGIACMMDWLSRNEFNSDH